MKSKAISDIFIDFEKFADQNLTPELLSSTLASTIDKGQLLPACFLLFCGAEPPALHGDTFFYKIQQQMSKENLYDVFLILAVQHNKIAIFDLLTKSNRWNKQFIASAKFSLKLTRLIRLAENLGFTNFSDRIYQLQKGLPSHKDKEDKKLETTVIELGITADFSETTTDVVLDIKYSPHQRITDHCFKLARQGLSEQVAEELSKQSDQTQLEVLHAMLERSRRNNHLLATHTILEIKPNFHRLAAYFAEIKTDLVQTLAIVSPKAVLKDTPQHFIVHDMPQNFDFLMDQASGHSAFLFSAFVDLFKEEITQEVFYTKFRYLSDRIGRNQAAHLANTQLLVYIHDQVGINIHPLIQEMKLPDNQLKSIDQLERWIDLSPETQDLIKFHARYTGLLVRRTDYGMPSHIWNTIKDYIHVHDPELKQEVINENKGHLQRLLTSDYGNFSMYSGQLFQSYLMVEEARRLIDKTRGHFDIPINRSRASFSVAYIIILATFLYLLTTLIKREHLFAGPDNVSETNDGGPMLLFIFNSLLLVGGIFSGARTCSSSQTPPRTYLKCSERTGRLFCHRPVDMGRFSARFLPAEFKTELDSLCKKAGHAKFNYQDTTIEDVRSELENIKSAVEQSIGAKIDSVANKEPRRASNEYELEEKEKKNASSSSSGSSSSISSASSSQRLTSSSSSSSQTSSSELNELTTPLLSNHGHR